ncbi:MAG TPA: hypothetical protein QGH10_15000 [Armatimonadota bacterium]|nr:hypothetical protein [Armatimonadota bacterium]
MSTWWATEKAKEAIQTGWGLDKMQCQDDRILLQDTETNLYVDMSGNITDGQIGPIIGLLDPKIGTVRDQHGKPTGTLAVA